MNAFVNRLHGSGVNPSGYTGTGYGFGLRQTHTPPSPQLPADNFTGEAGPAHNVAGVKAHPFWHDIGLPAYGIKSREPQPLGVLGHTTVPGEINLPNQPAGTPPAQS